MRRIFADRMREFLFTGLVAGSLALVSKYPCPSETADERLRPPLSVHPRSASREKKNDTPAMLCVALVNGSSNGAARLGAGASPDDYVGRPRRRPARADDHDDR